MKTKEKVQSKVEVKKFSLQYFLYKLKTLFRGGD